MCAAIDMLSSEQLFYGHSPPGGFLASYAPPSRRSSKSTTKGFSISSLPVQKPVQLTLKPTPRSCLKLQTEKTKKKVVFADDRGLALEHVKIINEPSHIPPNWLLNIKSSPPSERKPSPKPSDDIWEATFVQPASAYVEFRRRITEDYVSLENVIIKQSECAVDGTVKVRNLDFEKEVLIRTTSDGWRTHEDTYCAFLESGPSGKNGVSLYDTFAFRLALPVNSRRLDFCVRFKCKGNEYWDNNSGKNYTLVKTSVRNPPAVACARIKCGNSWSARALGADTNGNTPYW